MQKVEIIELENLEVASVLKRRSETERFTNLKKIITRKSKRASDGWPSQHDSETSTANLSVTA